MIRALGRVNLGVCARVKMSFHEYGLKVAENTSFTCCAKEKQKVYAKTDRLHSAPIHTTHCDTCHCRCTSIPLRHEALHTVAHPHQEPKAIFRSVSSATLSELVVRT